MNLRFHVGNFPRSLGPKPQEMLHQALLNLVGLVGAEHLTGFNLRCRFKSCHKRHCLKGLS